VTSAADRLIAYLDAEDPYDYRLDDLRELQLQAADERFQQVRDRMAVLQRRAGDTGVDGVGALADVVPLCFSDATYKSYPESFLTQGKWKALGAWLDALSTSSGAAAVDMTGVEDIDDWLGRLRGHGHFVYVSSGTSGRCSMLQVSERDRQVDLAGFQSVWKWKAGAKPDGNHAVFALFPSQGSHRMIDTFGKIVDAFGRPEATYYLSDEPLRVAEVNRLSRLNKAIGEGTANPSDIEVAQAQGAAKQAAMAEVMKRLGEAVVRHRAEPGDPAGRGQTRGDPGRARGRHLDRSAGVLRPVPGRPLGRIDHRGPGHVQSQPVCLRTVQPLARAGHRPLQGPTRWRRQGDLHRHDRRLCAADRAGDRPVSATLKITHVVRGQVRHDADVEHTSRIGESFLTPRLELDELVRSRSEPGPAFDLPIDEVLEFLGETGRRLDLGTNPYLAEAVDLMASVSPHSRRLVENQYRMLGTMFEPEALGYQVERELGVGTIDSWMPVRRPGVARCSVRAFPPRLVHIMAGNGAAAAAMSIVRGALTKGVNLLKLPSNDLCTATAILRTMIDIDPRHPTVHSFSAVYWRGGDTGVESLLYRPQYFDKLVAWGGEDTIRHALRYVGPGFELVSFDPKVSISMIGREVFAEGDDVLTRAVALGAADAALLNQEACAASRHQFVEGTIDEVDRYCELLADELAKERDWSDGKIWRTPGEIRDNVEGLRYTGEHGIWGGYDGRGLVVRWEEPVDFHPTAKTVNVIPVASLTEATRYAGVATQTVGVYPPARKAELRDRLACAGVQRVVSLGSAFGLATGGAGLPHDGFYPLARLMRWVSDEDSG
jgi:hypothetical protein